MAERHGADEALIAAVLLCVSEAVSNVVIHAYRDSSVRGDVELEARRPDGYLCIYVRDRGGGLNQRSDSPGAGFGLSIIEQVASALTVRSTDAHAGTEVAMRFELPE